MPEIDAIVQTVREGRVPPGIYSQPEVFELERERLFTRTWQYGPARLSATPARPRSARRCAPSPA